MDDFKKFKDDEIIEKSFIHENIKKSLTYFNGNYEWESDFMFGFIIAILRELNITEDEDDDDFEYKCYEWCINYFDMYLNISSDIINESSCILYTTDKKERDEALKEYRDYNVSKIPLNLTTDYKILNAISGRLYF